MINVKVSRDTYNFIKTLSKKYNVSVSAFCQDCITQSIIYHDKIANDSSLSGCSTADVYYKKLTFFINETYDSRRK